MQNTTNYNLKKPDLTDNVQISDFNGNFDIIDTQLKNNAEQLGSLSDSKGQANGIATLDGIGKLPTAQLPDMNYIPTSEKGIADGVATLDSSGIIIVNQISHIIPFAASDVTKFSYPTQVSKSTNVNNKQKVFEVKMVRGGSLRLKCEVSGIVAGTLTVTVLVQQRGLNGGASTALNQASVSGVAQGSWYPITFDFEFDPLKIIEVYLYQGTTTNTTTYIRNFELCGESALPLETLTKI